MTQWEQQSITHSSKIDYVFYNEVEATIIVRYKSSQKYYGYQGVGRWMYDEIFNDGNSVGHKTLKHFPFLDALGPYSEDELPKA